MPIGYTLTRCSNFRGHFSLDYLTVMTTRRSQTYSTPYGVIEFAHTGRQEEEILADLD